MIFVLDNYDSFTYNLVQLLGELGAKLKVRRNDQTTVKEIESLKPEAIVLSPGPGRPEDSGILLETIRHFAGMVPVLGVCLGHQAIGEVFGGKVVAAPSLVHGKTTEVLHDGKTIFLGLPQSFPAARYHSLVVAPNSIPADLEMSAHTKDGVVMGLRHRQLLIEGVQFHPESILTIAGPQLLKNFLNLIASGTRG
ncbi:MAG: aminodeoxychorismate/anthranilate synthase component II [Acidobacteria bacterium RIFCSPLOWO2_12_FULL_59_11]|nr:MAG: aminodeoxychorismate/anthranilate synthase component II [Acidobacteria bacterium RIFCSPLOWO2_12_FULL_59_11]